ncbi:MULTISPECIES: glutathione binding-like protein [unclassified Caballeronia]|uniref:glutathione binding-like protein n=1 Tax=unclassified Caballeronia TaxID=2646786 RepID=UPI00285C891D|nr:MULTISPECIES: glutathione binding-like protein [unclassified Caballeronia]MDR5777053.1 glutathione binding-like protein [Caballeronia sp. LZ002]MDR5798606.1 glutathione binding-like protein [Caballeronia sp. LZ001]MDR5852503.1 glutathione binding-like protein [Caballeronia sp. LZ003]
MAPVECSAHAIERFGNEAQRHLRLLDGKLAQREFAAGNDYSIADIGHFDWIWRRAFLALELTDTPHVARWYERISQRPAVQAAISRIEALAATAS